MFAWEPEADPFESRAVPGSSTLNENTTGVGRVRRRIPATFLLGSGDGTTMRVANGSG
jgi:hypothetical protein